MENRHLLPIASPPPCPPASQPGVELLWPSIGRAPWLQHHPVTPASSALPARKGADGCQRHPPWQELLRSSKSLRHPRMHVEASSSRRLVLLCPTSSPLVQGYLEDAEPTPSPPPQEAAASWMGQDLAASTRIKGGLVKDGVARKSQPSRRNHSLEGAHDMPTMAPKEVPRFN